ncbi:Protein CBG23812 [Caenorhabditis briggsae]|uniref:Protein CBG23812 n=1 Tax=Caenorhabditis briggsae TaxID=6238 RepID=A8WJC5_CAEBR|nr:Protein CBG23812 [Caenorhabditis briggsae]CAP20568.1 Protein CBG23812 [Caenorhabditis briggsae]
MEVFDTVKETLLAIISDGGDDEIHVEKLVAIGGLIRPDVVATAFQLMERQKVRELIVPASEIRQKARIFEDFQEKSIFDWKSEWELRRGKRKRRGMEKYRETQTRRSFVEVAFFWNF